jgi:hypothetical protein
LDERVELSEIRTVKTRMREVDGPVEDRHPDIGIAERPGVDGRKSRHGGSDVHRLSICATAELVCGGLSSAHQFLVA